VARELGSERRKTVRSLSVVGVSKLSGHALSTRGPEYLLSFERWPFHAEPPDHFSQLSLLLDVFVSQSSTLLLMRSAYDYQPY